MTARRRWRITVGIGCTFAFLLVSFGSAKSAPKQDRSWKHYRNPQLGYCLSYPSRWVKGEGFDGAGFWIESGEKKFSKPLGAIDVAVLTPPQIALLTSPVALAENFQVHLDGLQKFERAERIEVLEKRDTELLGAAALYVKDRYYDPMDRATWIEADQWLAPRR